MAGGKQTPRQKMINLMYLVFIAMMALNMSKEVLSAFGEINVSLTKATENFEDKNKDSYQGLEQKAKDNPEQFSEVFQKAKVVQAATQDYFNYLGDLKTELEGSVDDPTDYETMDKGSYLDEKFLKSGKLTPDGQEFMSKMKAYRSSMTDALGDDEKFSGIVSSINEKFSGEDITDGDNVTKSYIEYHYVGFPLISSITKISTLQNDIKVAENELYSIMLAGQLTEIASMDNYETLLQSDRGAYYQGTTFDGSIVLGRSDDSTRPSEVKLELDGRKLEEGKDYDVHDGRVQLNVDAGAAGDRQITGELIFMQDGKEIVVPVDQKYAVIPKPEQAIVSADKMNVVYRGIDNPITVSMPGVPENKINASAPGLSRVSGTKYNLKPQSGTEVKINVTGEIEGETMQSPPVTFRIKSLPRPTATVRGEIQDGGPLSMPRNALQISPIGAQFENFDFDITPVVKGFTVSIPGKPSVEVRGDRFNQEAKNLLNQANAGDVVTIFDVRADVPGVNVKKMPPVQVKLTN